MYPTRGAIDGGDPPSYLGKWLGIAILI